MKTLLKIFFEENPKDGVLDLTADPGEGPFTIIIRSKHGKQIGTEYSGVVSFELRKFYIEDEKR